MWSNWTPKWARELKEQNHYIIQQLGKIMASLDQVLADVTEESTQLDSISTLITGLRSQIATALASAGTIPPDVQAKVDAIFTQAEANKAKIATALNANVAQSAPATSSASVPTP